MRHTADGTQGVLDRSFRSNRLPVAPQGDFLDVEKVTKDTHRERVF